VVDLRTHRAIDLPHPVRDEKTLSVKGAPYGVSAYWGDKPTGKADPRINVAGV